MPQQPLQKNDRTAGETSRQVRLTWCGLALCLVAYQLPISIPVTGRMLYAHMVLFCLAMIGFAVVMQRWPVVDVFLAPAGTVVMGVGFALSAVLPPFWTAAINRVGVAALFAVCLWRVSRRFTIPRGFLLVPLALTVAMAVSLLLVAVGCPPWGMMLVLALAGVLASVLFWLQPRPPAVELGRNDFGDFIRELRWRLPRRFGLTLLFIALCAVFSVFNNLASQLYSNLVVSHYGSGLAMWVYILMGLGFVLAGWLMAKNKWMPLLVCCGIVIQCLIILLLIPDELPMALWALVPYRLASMGISAVILLGPFLLPGFVDTPVRSVTGLVSYSLLNAFVSPELYQRMGAETFYRWFSGLNGLLLLAILFVAFWIVRVYILRGRQRAEGGQAQAPLELPDSLTTREREVAALLIDGNDRAEIARALNISPSTVNQHCNNVFRKTGSDGHIDLHIKYFRLGRGGPGSPPQ